MVFGSSRLVFMDIKCKFSLGYLFRSITVTYSLSFHLIFHPLSVFKVGHRCQTSSLEMIQPPFEMWDMSKD